MLVNPIRDNVRIIVKAFAKATGRSITWISKEFYGNADFLPLFFAGQHSISVKKLEDMLYGVDGIVTLWPAKAPWPACRVVVFRGPGRPVRRRGKISPEKQRAA